VAVLADILALVMPRLRKCADLQVEPRPSGRDGRQANLTWWAGGVANPIRCGRPRSGASPPVLGSRPSGQANSSLKDSRGLIGRHDSGPATASGKPSITRLSSVSI
jgi:hypothetical protein